MWNRTGAGELHFSFVDFTDSHSPQLILAWQGQSYHAWLLLANANNSSGIRGVISLMENGSEGKRLNPLPKCCGPDLN